MKRSRIIALAILPLLLSAAAEADEPPETVQRRSGSEILLQMEESPTRRNWLQHTMDRVRLGDSGLAYSRSLNVRKRRYDLTVSVPGVDAGSYGLAVELRF